MKKFFAISLAIVYLAISSGVVLNIHYCMGEIAEVAFGQHKSDKCGQCGMENDGCCHDDVKVVKIEDSQSLTTINADFTKAETLARSYPDLSLAVYILPLSIDTRTAAVPPGKTDIPLNILHCVFRI